MKYDGTNLKEVLEAHKRWLTKEEGWKEDDRADMSRADLYKADLRGAELYGANLRGADLRRADLSGADLRRADLRGAELYEADLRGAELYGAKNVPFIPMTCPDSGAFVGWKKVCVQHGYGEYAIAKLLIAEDAKRSSATTRKCRADYVEVLELQALDGTRLPAGVEGYSMRGGEHMALYREGKRVSADGWDEDRWNECSHGIHFFINRHEAVEYQM